METTNAIREARKKHGSSLQQVATIVGVSKVTVSGWERGRMLPHPSRVPALIKALPGLTFAKIYAGAEPSGKAA
jgi:transcriptional regulator with XRE-family HTH domain